MTQFNLSGTGTFILLVLGVTFILFWMSNNNGSDLQPGANILSIRALISTSLDAAEFGGQAITELTYRTHLNARGKRRFVDNKKELVTDADLISNQCIFHRLSLLTTEIRGQIRSEESEIPDQKSNELIHTISEIDRNSNTIISQLPERDMYLELGQVTMWVDPLDATNELSQNQLEYVTVMICGAVQGIPIFGVVHFPFMNSTFWSWLPNDISANLRTKALQTPREVLKILISNTHAGADLKKQIIEAFAPTKVTIVAAGGTGFKMIELAKGSADLYIHPSGARRWDLCAPQSILEASGGVVRSMTGQAFTFYRHDKDRVGAETGIFATANRVLFNKWAPTVAKLHASINLKSSSIP